MVLKVDVTSTTLFNSGFARNALSPESRHSSGFLGLDPLPPPLHRFVPSLFSHILKFLSQSFLLNIAPLEEVRLRLPSCLDGLFLFLFMAPHNCPLSLLRLRGSNLRVKRHDLSLQRGNDIRVFRLFDLRLKVQYLR